MKAILCLGLMILLSASVLGQWFTYRPEGLAGVTQGEHPYMTQVTERVLDQGRQWLQTSIVFSSAPGEHGARGGGGGEWWVFVDLNAGYGYPVQTDLQLMDMSISVIDGDIFTPWSSQSVPITPPTKEVYVFWLLWNYHVATVVQRPSQLGGSSFVIDMHSWHSHQVPIARFEIPPSLSNMFPTLDVHVIGNLDTELDGAGWVDLHENLDI